MHSVIDFFVQLMKRIEEKELLISSIAGIIAILAIPAALIKWLISKLKSPPSEANTITFNFPTDFGNLVGRKSVLKEIRKALKTKKFVWLSGMGGIGKSHVSSYIAQRYYSNSSILFKWKGDYKTTITYGDNIFSSPASIGDTLNEKVFAVKEALIRRKGQTLIIFDGVDVCSEDDISFFTQLALHQGLFLLVTSRTIRDTNDNITLPLMSISESRSLFWYYYLGVTRQSLARTKSPEDLQYIDAIIEKSGYHSLTIKLLACYAKANQISLSELTGELVNSSQNPLSSLASVIKTGHQASYETISACITRLINISLKSAKEEKLAAVMALFPGIEIPGEFILDITSNTTKKDLYHLRDESWITMTKKDCYKMHAVIAEVIRTTLPILQEEQIELAKKLLPYVEYPMEKFCTIDNQELLYRGWFHHLLYMTAVHLWQNGTLQL